MIILLISAVLLSVLASFILARLMEESSKDNAEAYTELKNKKHFVVEEIDSINAFVYRGNKQGGTDKKNRAEAQLEHIDNMLDDISEHYYKHQNSDKGYIKKGKKRYKL